MSNMLYKENAKLVDSLVFGLEDGRQHRAAKYSARLSIRLPHRQRSCLFMADRLRVLHHLQRHVGDRRPECNN